MNYNTFAHENTQRFESNKVYRNTGAMVSDESLSMMSPTDGCPDSSMDYHQRDCFPDKEMYEQNQTTDYRDSDYEQDPAGSLDNQFSTLSLAGSINEGYKPILTFEIQNNCEFYYDLWCWRLTFYIALSDPHMFDKNITRSTENSSDTKVTIEARILMEIGDVIDEARNHAIHNDTANALYAMSYAQLGLMILLKRGDSIHSKQA